MRNLALTTTLLLLATAVPLAAAHPHGDCAGTPSPLIVHVDVFGKPCAGVIVRPSVTTCGSNDLHLVEGVHVVILDGPGCGTGVVVELP